MRNDWLQTRSNIVPVSFSVCQRASLYMRTRYTDRNLMPEVYSRNYSVVLLSTGGLFQDRRSVPRADLLQVHLVAWLVGWKLYCGLSNTQIHKYKFTNTQILPITKFQKYSTCSIFLASTDAQQVMRVTESLIVSRFYWWEYLLEIRLMWLWWVRMPDDHNECDDPDEHEDHDDCDDNEDED